MKKKILHILFAVSLMANLAFFADAVFGHEKSSEPTVAEQVQTAPADDWQTFIAALSWVESRHDNNAVSSKQAVGYLQITPILVEDANRILGQETFSLEGRRDREESIHLFNVIQDHYNPEHDLHLALKIWNPRSKLSYHTAVMNRYRELLRDKESNRQTDIAI